MMNILITGSCGFLGKNLIAKLNAIRDNKDKTTGLTNNLNIFQYDIDTDPSFLDGYCQAADFVIHLAGVNRPQNPDEFMTGNFEFLYMLLNLLKKHQNNCPVMVSSSIQAVLNNPYGKSKKAAEDLLFNYGRETGAKVLVYRFPNIFGKWCKPNYNSVIATFCFNIANGSPIAITDRSVQLNLVYIDDVVEELINALCGNETYEDDFCKVSLEYKITLGEIVNLLYSFKTSREELSLPDMSNEFTKKLYATYISYLPVENFSYPLEMNIDERGSFTEIFRTMDRGQFSVNISKPGIIKGNHWHQTKNEKFLVVSGRGVIRFRKIDEDKIIEYYVSGEKFMIIDIPVGYTHNIENLGDKDLVTFIWCSECYDSNKPDTVFLEV